MTGVTNTSGAQFSSWSKLTQGVTVQTEVVQQQQKIATQVKNTWGNPAGIQAIRQQVSNTSTMQSKKVKPVGAQSLPPKKDAWDSNVGKYLSGVSNRSFDEYPHHNASYEKKGKHGAKQQTQIQNQAIAPMIGKTVNIYQLQAAHQQAVAEGASYNNAIENADNHRLPLVEIFQNYDSIKLCKAKFENVHYAYYIPCTINTTGEEWKYGILEVTLAGQAQRKDLLAKPMHVFFKPVIMNENTSSWLANRYGGNSANLLTMLNALTSSTTPSVKFDCEGSEGVYFMRK